MTLSDEQKALLRKIPKTRCVRCNSVYSRTNPMAKCFECGKRFCFDHIYGGQVNKSMSENERIRDICEKCKAEFNYQTL